jgi:hypothetical protein
MLRLLRKAIHTGVALEKFGALTRRVFEYIRDLSSLPWHLADPQPI